VVRLGVDIIDVGQNRGRWCFCECGNEPSSSIKYGEILG